MRNQLNENKLNSRFQMLFENKYFGKTILTIALQKYNII
jgi:hypothetical protein